MLEVASERRCRTRARRLCRVARRSPGAAVVAATAATLTSWWPVLRRYPVVTRVDRRWRCVCFPATWPLDERCARPAVALVDDRAGRRPRRRTCRCRRCRRCSRAAQVWRLVTPIFIHFGVAHLLFNAAVVIEFGRRIERGAGSPVLLLTDAADRRRQQRRAVSRRRHAALFGGLSGVAYGLFAYVVVRGRFDRGAGLARQSVVQHRGRGHARADEHRRHRSCSVCTSPIPCIGSGSRVGAIAAAAVATRHARDVNAQLTIVESLGQRCAARHAHRVRRRRSTTRCSSTSRSSP